MQDRQAQGRSRLNKKDLRFPIAFLLAIVFSVALVFVTIEIPTTLNRLLLAHFPDLGFQTEQISEFMGYARTVGYACLVTIVVLVILGFVTKRRRLSLFGSTMAFLPTFGYFACSMFFLAGVGILRTLWVPLWDLSPSFLRLGDVVYLPYMALAFPFALAGVNIGHSLALTAIGAGGLIFFSGTVAWLYGKFKKLELINFWIYRYSRHPQYLGFLVWSYGVMLLATLAPFPRGGYVPGPSLPWLVSALIVICIALREEIDMSKRWGEKYLKYRNITPFMLPLPKFISVAIMAPIRVLLRKDLPESGREIIYTFMVYGVLFMLVSIPFLVLNWPPGYGWAAWPFV